MRKIFWKKIHIISCFLGVLFCFTMFSFSTKATTRTVLVGETIQLFDTNWENATGYEKTWEVTNPMVASISYSGTTCTVRGLRSGTTKVLCYTRAWKTTVTSVLVNGKWQQRIQTNYLPTSKSSHTIHVKENYTITFMANGGTVAENTRKVAEGDAIGTLPEAMRAGYHFEGWYSGAIRISESTICDRNEIYQARWTPVTVATGSVKNFTKGYKEMTVTVNSLAGADGYEVRYSLKPNMENAEIKNVTGNMCTLTGLKAGKKYYVSVRAYAFDSTGAKIYGEWSSVKSTKLPKIMLDKSQTVLLKGQTGQLKLQGAKTGVKWSSKKSSVATVSKNGKVKAKKTGTTTITAKYKNKKYTCKVKVENPELTHKNIKLLVGQEKKIKLKKTSCNITWSSKNYQVAAVNKGAVTGKAAGTTVIKATANGKSFSCKVKVENPVLSDTSLQMLKGQTRKIKLSGTTFAVKFSSSNSKVVSVNKKGILTAKDAGNAKIIAKANGKEFVCTVKVEAPSLSQTNVIMGKGEKLRITLDNTTLPPVWSSSDSSVVEVISKFGDLSGKKKGTAVITATVNGMVYKCNVIVEEPVCEITELSLNVGEKGKITFTGTQRKPVFEVAYSQTGVQVSDNGEVTAVKAGVYEVIGKLGNYSYRCRVVVFGDLGTQTNPRKASERFTTTVYDGSEKLGTFSITMKEYTDSSQWSTGVYLKFEVYTREKSVSKTIGGEEIFHFRRPALLLTKSLQECYLQDCANQQDILRQGETTVVRKNLTLDHAIYEPIIYPIQTGYDAATGEKIYTYFITE